MLIQLSAQTVCQLVRSWKCLTDCQSTRSDHEITFNRLSVQPVRSWKRSTECQSNRSDHENVQPTVSPAGQITKLRSTDCQSSRSDHEITFNRLSAQTICQLVILKTFNWMIVSPTGLTNHENVQPTIGPIVRMTFGPSVRSKYNAKAEIKIIRDYATGLAYISYFAGGM